MPIYAYHCENCEYEFEEIQSLSEKPLKKCPECKKNKLIKLISLPARPVVPEHPMEMMAKIRRDAQQTAKRIVSGDQAAIADIYGEDIAAGKPRKDLSKPKTFNDIKGKSAVKKKK